MRIVGILVRLALCAAVGTAGACKAKTDASATPDPAALKAQQDLIARRDALMAQRQKLQAERDKLEVEIRQVETSGGDTTDLVKQREAIDNQIEGQESDLSSLTSKLDQVVAQGDAAAGIAVREASMGTREKSVATREAQLAERERTLAQREAQLAARERETCGAPQPMIIQQAAPKSGSYSRRDIEPLLKRARTAMAKKGVLVADLPGPAQGLEAEATRAMAAGDWGKAYFAAAQLAGTVEAVKIDRAFIMAKHRRLNDKVKGGKLDERTTQELTGGMQDVVQKYGDGDFAAANRKLNQLWALLR